MEKLDLTKKYKAYYSAKSKPEIIETGEAQYLSIQGKGDPSGQQFAENIQALYATAFSVKFISKAIGKDFVVPRLEGLWSFDEKKYSAVAIEEAPLKIPRSEWLYRLMIRMPDYVTQAQVATAVQQVVTKKEILPAKNIELFTLHEGKSVQVLHTGPFADEPQSLALIASFVKTHHLQKNGLHHEIYLSDFRRTAPEKLKTILREPVK